MKRILSRYLVLLGLVLVQRVDAQAPPAGGARGATAEARAPVEDPLGRSTPQGTSAGFIQAAQQGNLERAAEYLDSRLRPPARQELARKLGVVLDRKLVAGANRLSTRPEGDLQDGLRVGRDRIGVVESASGNVDVFLDRVERGQNNFIWLFSSDVLAETSRLYDEVRPRWIEQYLPAWLRTIGWLSIPIYGWIGILLFLPLVFGLAALLTRLLALLLAPLLRRLHRDHDAQKLPSLGPLRLQVLALLFYFASFLGFTLASRRFWRGVADTLTVVAVCWLLLRVMDFVSALMLARLQRTNRSEETALVRLLNRLSKAAVVIVAGLALLYLGGVDLTAVLAGLGVGGLAIGFGAQKTIENVFGGIMVISDKPVNVGETCQAGEYFGTVEDIGLRSTRIRTLDRTVVSIPNGQLANMSLENYAVRDRIWLHHTVGLQLQTTADQLRAVLTGIRGLLEAHPRVDTHSARARFIKFGIWSLDIEIFAYVLERDYTAFLAIQEELLLGVMDTIDASGTSIAVPVSATLPGEGRRLEPGSTIPMGTTDRK